MHARVGIDVQHTGVAGDFVQAHLHAGVNCANHHVNLVTLHNFGGIFDAFGRVCLIIDLEPLNLAAPQFATFLIDGHAKCVFNVDAQLGKRTGIRQHEAHADFGALRPADAGQQKPGRCGSDDGCAAG